MKKATMTLGILQSFIALLAIPAGWSMIFEPDGSGIGISTEILQTSPFPNFYIPGLFLFIGNGLCHLTGAVFSFKKSKLAGIIGIGLGIFLLTWIMVQVYYTAGIIHFLQPLFFVVAIVEIIFGVVIFLKIKKNEF